MTEHEQYPFEAMCTGSGYCHNWKAQFTEWNPETKQLEIHTIYRDCDKMLKGDI